MAASCTTPRSSICPGFSTPNSFRSLPSGKPLLKETKQVILNVYSRLRDNPSFTIKETLTEAARLTGVSASTLAKIKTEGKTLGQIRSPLRRSLDFGRRKKRLNCISKNDSLDMGAIGRKVHAFFSRNEIPTLEKILEALKESGFPDLKRTSLFRILKSLCFKFQARKRNSALISKPELIHWRAYYLREIKNSRSAGRPIYFLDETWVNAGHTKAKVWHDTNIESARQAWAAELTVGLTAPSGKGSRLILTHAGNEDGFVPGCLDIFQGKKGSGDYHEEMDGNRFQHWFTEKLLPNIKPNSVIVMDNAAYHSVRSEKLPTTKTKKAEIQSWLTSKDIMWSQKMLVRDLLALVEPLRARYTSYQIDKIAEQAGHTVLRLPPYHCELNPIELIWSQVKGYVASQNKSFKLAEVRILFDRAIARVTADDWKKCVQHVVEPKFWKLDGLTSAHVEQFIINCRSN